MLSFNKLKKQYKFLKKQPLSISKLIFQKQLSTTKCRQYRCIGCLFLTPVIILCCLCLMQYWLYWTEVGRSLVVVRPDRVEILSWWVATRTSRECLCHWLPPNFNSNFELFIFPNDLCLCTVIFDYRPVLFFCVLN